MLSVERKKFRIETWKAEVFDQVKDVDPNDQYCWESLAYGFFLSKGYSPEYAKDLVETANKEGLI